MSLLNKSSTPDKNSSGYSSESSPLVKNANSNNTEDDEAKLLEAKTEAPEDHYHVVYFTLLFLGVALLLTYNSFVAAPDYTSHYYKYAAQDESLNATMPSVWKHISPFITATNMVPNLFCQIAMLSNFVQKIPTLKRLYFAILLNAVAMLMVPLAPLFKVDEKAALTILLIGDAVCGGATALLQSSAFGIAAQFPILHMQATMLGIGVSGTVVSLLQIITYAAFGSDFSAVLKQSSVFFGIGVLALIVLVIILPGFRRNRFARHYVLEWKRDDARLTESEQIHEVTTRGTFAAMSSGEIYPENRVTDSETSIDDDDHDDNNNNNMEKQRALSNRSMAEKLPSRNGIVVAQEEAGIPGKTEAEEAAEREKENAADRHVDVLHVLNVCKGNMFANFFVYFISLIIFPGLGVDVDPDNEWYGIIIIFLFNFGDFSGRMLCRFPTFLFQGKDYILQIIAAFRTLFLPIFFLAVEPKLITAGWIPMVAMYFVGITNGFTSAQLMMFTPAHPDLEDYERPTAGSAMSLSLLAGCSAGSLTALLLSQTYLANSG